MKQLPLTSLSKPVIYHYFTHTNAFIGMIVALNMKGKLDPSNLTPTMQRMFAEHDIDSSFFENAREQVSYLTAFLNTLSEDFTTSLRGEQQLAILTHRHLTPEQSKAAQEELIAFIGEAGSTLTDEAITALQLKELTGDWPFSFDELNESQIPSPASTASCGGNCGRCEYPCDARASD